MQLARAAINSIRTMITVRLLFRLSILSVILMVAAAAYAQQGNHTSASRQKVEREDDAAEREEFFYDRVMSGTIKDIDEIHRLGYASFSSLGNRAAMKEQSSSAWQSVGTGLGGYASGRIRSIVFDPVDSNTAYVAATVGGLWKTTDYTADPVVWQPLADNLPTLVCTCLAIPSQEPKTIYVGTGETDPGYIASDGRGVFKSTDGGLNWTNVLSSSIMGPTCAQITIDPQHPETIFVAAPARLRDFYRGKDTTHTYGLFRSTDGGMNWTKLSLPANPFPVSVVIDPIKTRNVTVSCLAGEIFHSNDGGATWQAASISYADTVINPVLAISQSDPSILFACVSANLIHQGSGFTTEGLYKSTDSGMTWQLINDGSANAGFPSGWLGTQGEYCNAIAVDPANPLHLVVGGLDNYESLDGGVTFDSISQWWMNSTDAFFSHADIHALVFHNGLIFCGSDGGLSSYDGAMWSHGLTAGMPTLQIVCADADPDFNFIIGGTQDNGTNVTPVAVPEWIQTRGGDGGNTWVSPGIPLRVFATYVRTNIYRSDDSLQTWSDNTSFGSLITNNALLNESSPFYSSYDVSSDGMVVAFGGFHHVFISHNGGDDGFQYMGVPVIDTSTSILISPTNSNKLWAGATSHVFRSTNEGSHWTSSSLGVAGQVVGLALGATDTVVYAVLGGLTNDSNAHFQKSTNGGATWTTPATNFPMTPANSLARSSSGQLFVGTDYGVIISTDDGVTWSQFGLGMPRVQVLSLKLKGKQGQYLLAGTQGRGVYYITLPTQGVEPLTTTQFAVGECYPNPVNASRSSELRVTLTESKKLTATLYDALGHALQVLASTTFNSGDHALPIPTNNLASGDYFVVLQAGNEAVIRKLVVTR
jgi:photosystem II stability/assembly factor-like uncharacterized protein